MPFPCWHGRDDDRVAVANYLFGVALLLEAPFLQRSGLFDLRAESVRLTAMHTIARVHRGAA